MNKSAPFTIREKIAALPNMLGRALENPVILKELRGRMRGRRAYILLTVYLILISLLIGVIYSFLAVQSNLLQWNPGFRQIAGKTIFSTVVLFEFLFIGFIGPALTAGAITSERERQTFDLLRTTLLSARSLVLGKLGSACTYLFLLIFTALPIQALAFLLGGVGMEELFVSSLMLVVNAIFFCALGLFCSSFTRRTLTATVTSYSTILLSILGLGMASFIITFSMSSSFSNSTVVTLMAILLWLMTSTNAFSAAIVSETFLIQNQSLFLITIPFPNGGGLSILSPWILHVLLYLALTALMIFLSIQFVKRPDR